MLRRIRVTKRLTAIALCMALMLTCILTIDLTKNGAESHTNTDIVSIEAIDETSVSLTWNGVDGVNGYKVYRSTSADGIYVCVYFTSPKNTTYVNKGLAPGTTYYYKVTSYSASENGMVENGFGAVSSVTTKSVPVVEEVPETPVVPETPIVEVTPEVPAETTPTVAPNEEQVNEQPTVENAPVEIPENKPETPVVPETPVAPETPVVSNPTTETPKVEVTTPDTEQMVLDILEMMNADRRALGIHELVLDEDLCEIAKIRAEETATLYSHTRPNGTKYWTLYDELGIYYSSCCGENLKKYSKTAKSFYQAWYNSPGHRANMERERFTRVGMYIYVDENGRMYAAQEFSD